MTRLRTGDLRLGIQFPALSSFDNSWSHRNRQIDVGLVYLILRGGIRAQALGRVFEIRAGGLLMVAPGVKHDFTLLDGSSKFTLYHLRIAPKLSNGQSCWLHEDVIVRPQFLHNRQYFDECVREYQTELPWYEARLHAAFVCVFSEIFRSAPSKAASTGLNLNQQARIIRLVVEKNRVEPATPRLLAAALGLSPTYFARLFRRTFQMQPRVWLVRERLRRASIELIESSRSIGEIASLFGYDNAFLFTRQFTKAFGVSPRRFRQNHGGKK